MRFGAFILLVFCYCTGFGQNPPEPELKCISVLPNGNLQLTWIPPADPFNQFLRYYIYASADGINFIQETTINNHATTTYTYASGNGNTATYWFYMQAEFNSGATTDTSISSDTLRSMLLAINGSNTGYASLTWNQMHNPNIPTVYGWYLVSRSLNSAGPWTKIDSSQHGVEFLTDAKKFCDDMVYYKVELIDFTGCTSVSNIAGAQIADVSPPDIPAVDSVSIDTSTGMVMIGWFLNTDDTQDYLVEHKVPPTNFYDTVFGINSAFYLHPNANGNSGSQSLSVFAYDTCSKSNRSATGGFHETIFLQTPTVDLCTGEIILNWSGYIGWSGGVANYLVLESVNNGPYNIVSTNSSGNTSYTASNINLNSQYCYVIRAQQNGGTATSTSNKQCVTTVIPNPPTRHYITNVTVAGENQIDLECLIDSSSTVTNFVIKRSLNSGSGFQTIATVPMPMDTFITYTDNDVETNTNSYYYVIAAVDACNIELINSNTSQSILLNAQADSVNLVNTLNWNFYTDWASAGSGVSSYEIFRETNGIYESSPVGITSLIQNNLVDDVSQLLTSGGEFCYYVEAVENTGNIYGFTNRSRSNEVCVSQNSIIWVPNAFTPNGDNINDVFRPQVSFTETGSFALTIYNRWGSPIYTTDNPEKGWDGLDAITGNLAQDGVYIYHLSYGADGTEKVHRGTITLIK